MQNKKNPNQLFAFIFILFGFEKAKKSNRSMAPEIKKLTI
jgi:hypothetical protein